MLLWWPGGPLIAQSTQAAGNHQPGLTRQDDAVDVAALRGDIRVRQGVLVFGQQPSTFGIRIGGRGKLLAVQDIYGPLPTHHRDLRGGPGQIQIGAKMLRAHDVVGTAVGLSGDHGHQRHGGFGVSVNKLRAAADDAVPFLVGARKEAGNVNES